MQCHFGSPAGDYRGLQAARVSKRYSETVAAMKRLEQFAVLAVINSAVGEHAVHVEDYQLDFLRPIERVARNFHFSFLISMACRKIFLPATRARLTFLLLAQKKSKQKKRAPRRGVKIVVTVTLRLTEAVSARK